MDWQQRYAEKLTSAEEAAREVASGNRVWVGMLGSVPLTFAKALHARHQDLKDVAIYNYISPFPWATDEARGAFTLHTAFTTPVDRTAVAEGRAEYIPIGNFSRDHLLAYHPRMEIGVVKMSPPDANGYLSFSDALWANLTIFIALQALVRRDRRAADPDARARITCISHRSSASSRMIPATTRAAPIPPRDPEVEDAANVICTLVASELIHDGDCLQMGLGDVSAALAIFLDNHHDIGIQTEMIPGGVVEMLERGVITGARKQVAPGKVVGSAFAQTPAEEIAKAHLHPQIDLWDFCKTDDLRMLVQNENFKTINNALQIDVTGQVTAETLGTRTFSGPGGQTSLRHGGVVLEGPGLDHRSARLIGREPGNGGRGSCPRCPKARW